LEFEFEGDRARPRETGKEVEDGWKVSVTVFRAIDGYGDEWSMDGEVVDGAAAVVDDSAGLMDGPGPGLGLGLPGREAEAEEMLIDLVRVCVCRRSWRARLVARTSYSNDEIHFNQY